MWLTGALATRSRAGARACARGWRRSAPVAWRSLLGALVIALAAPLVSPHDPLKQDLGNALAAPSRAHLLGTDNVGRDVLSRVIWGTRVSLVAGFVSVALARWPAGCSAWPRATRAAASTGC